MICLNGDQFLHSTLPWPVAASVVNPFARDVIDLQEVCCRNKVFKTLTGSGFKHKL